MSNNSQTLQILKEGFDEVAKRFPTGSESMIMTDILIQVIPESGQINIFDDDDNEIYSSIVEAWVGDGEDDYINEVKEGLKDYIQSQAEQLDNLSILKPYSFVMIDEDKETIEELRLVDDQLIVLDSESLMQDLDKDLDDFFEKLMAD